MKAALKIFGVVVLVLFLVVVGAGVYIFYQFDKPFRDARHLLLHDADCHHVNFCSLPKMLLQRKRNTDYQVSEVPHHIL
jgi:hypothetical protein